MVKKNNLKVGSFVIVNDKIPLNGSSYEPEIGLRFFGNIPKTSIVCNSLLIAPGEKLEIVSLPKKRDGINLIEFKYQNAILMSYWTDFKFRTNHA